MKSITQSFFLIFFFAFPAFSQEPDSVEVAGVPDSVEVAGVPDSVVVSVDSISVPLTRRERRHLADSLTVKELDPNHSSKKAIMYALVLPGMGQAYNGKYYKIPIVAAALGGVGYLIVDNTNNYRESVNNYIALPNEETKWYLEAWRRNMELSYIGMIAVYALQVLDAYVDSQLYYWDVNEDLSLRISPSLQPMTDPSGSIKPLYSLTCSFDLKRK